LELGERSVDRLLPYLREILLVLGRMGKTTHPLLCRVVN